MEAEKAPMLVVVSDTPTRRRLETLLTNHTDRVVHVECSTDLPPVLKQSTWAAVFIAYQLRDGSGLDLIDVVHRHSQSTPVILLGDRKQSTALAAVRHGADDYLPTPLRKTELAEALTHAYRAARARCAAQAPQPQPHALSQQEFARLLHEINNPLTPIIGLAEMLFDDLPPDHPGRTYATDIKTAAWRIHDAVRRLRMAPSA